MILSFETEWLCEVCEKGSQARKEFGTRSGQKLLARLNHLKVANAIKDIPPPKAAVNADRVTVAVSELGDIIAVSGHVKNLSGVEPTNWDKVTRLKIVAIGGRQ